MLKADAVYKIVLNRIVETELSPGERFTEKQIVESTGYGAMPVREAMDRLRRDGLIRTLPRQGNMVTPITLESAEHFFEIWVVLIPTLYEIAAKRISDELIIALKENTKFSKQLIRSQKINPRKLLLATTDRFEILLTAAGNPQLKTITERLLNESNRIMTYLSSDPRNRFELQRLLADTDEEIKAFDERNGTRAAKISRNRIRKLRGLIRTALSSHTEREAQEEL